MEQNPSEGSPGSQTISLPSLQIPSMSKAEQQLGVVDELDGMWQSETVMQSWSGDTYSPYKDRWTKRLMRYGVESRGTSTCNATLMAFSAMMS